MRKLQSNLQDHSEKRQPEDHIQNSCKCKSKENNSHQAAATSKAKITYRSSNTKVATVSSKGVVKGVKKGKAVIYVSSNGITKKVTVTVK